MIKLLTASFECVPFAKVGGLADVAGTLPVILKQLRTDSRIILPLHKAVERKKHSLKKLKNKIGFYVGKEYLEAGIWECMHENVHVYFIENARFFGRDEIYATPEGEYPDNPLRFIFFSRAVLESCKALNFKPDIVHCNDNHTGLIPAYLKIIYKADKFYSGVRSVFTIHNIAYQGIYPKEIFYTAGFTDEYFVPDKLEFCGQINFMKSGIVFADIVTTVSKTYAYEISTCKEFGRGLEGVLANRKADLHGIMNGIDYDYWNPSTDPCIDSTYTPADISGKIKCKTALQKITGLKKSNVPVFGMVSRLVEQKGFDILAPIMEALDKMPVQVILLGRGEQNYEDMLAQVKKKCRNNVRVFIDFNEQLAHKIYAGSDMFLMPSYYEPCGLGQMIAMRYGTVPIVRKTGGLADSVEQFNSRTKKGTGFVFEECSGKALLEAIRRSMETYKNKALWNALVKNTLKQDFSWTASAKEYLKIYGNNHC